MDKKQKIRKLLWTTFGLVIFSAIILLIFTGGQVVPFMAIVIGLVLGTYVDFKYAKIEKEHPDE